MELGDLASIFSSQHQSPWVSGFWTQAPLFWDHGEISVVLGGQLEQAMGDLGEGLAINRCWCICWGPSGAGYEPNGAQESSQEMAVCSVI